MYVCQSASLDDQMDVAERIVKQNGYKVVKRFREKASASKHGNRPQFGQMIKMIEQGKANGIICWQANRLARNPGESGLVQQLLLDGKIQMIHTNDRIYYPWDNVLIFGVEAGMAALLCW